MAIKPRPVPPGGGQERRPVASVRENVSICFAQYSSGGRYCLSSWEKQDTRRALDTLRKLSERTWEGIRQTGGLYYKELQGDTRRDVAPSVSPDVRVVEVRVSLQARLIGCRQGNTFAIIRFDRAHATTG